MPSKKSVINRRVIINIYDDTDPELATLRVSSVIENGLISNHGTAYCYCSTFKDGIVVYAETSRALRSHIFRVWKEK